MSSCVVASLSFVASHPSVAAILSSSRMVGELFLALIRLLTLSQTRQVWSGSTQDSWVAAQSCFCRPLWGNLVCLVEHHCHELEPKNNKWGKCYFFLEVFNTSLTWAGVGSARSSVQASYCLPSNNITEPSSKCTLGEKRACANCSPCRLHTPIGWRPTLVLGRSQLFLRLY